MLSRRLAAALILCSFFNQCPVSAHYETEADNKNSKHLKSTQVFDPWKLLDLALTPAYGFTNNVRIEVKGDYRYVRSNGIPNHQTGEFPNRGNPNTISEQNYVFRMPAKPTYSGPTMPVGMADFGVAINGVPFDPGANEYWNRDRNSGWQYEAMYLGPRLGLDQNNAHVQPDGAYHYHGPPTGLLQRLAALSKPVLIGYAADGFPIYGPYGHKNANDTHSPIVKLRSSYRLKGGSRSSGPGGAHNGEFVQDYEYEAGLGDLDECNGRVGITPEYQAGTYYYVISDAYPFISRRFKGAPDASFERKGHSEDPNGRGLVRRSSGGFPGGGSNGGFPGGGPPSRSQNGGFPGGGPPSRSQNGGFPGGGPPGGGPNGGFPDGGPPDSGQYHGTGG
jgi:hypothetical protein